MFIKLFCIWREKSAMEQFLYKIPLLVLRWIKKTLQKSVCRTTAGEGGLGTFGQLRPSLIFFTNVPHSRRRNSHKNVTFSKFLMHFQSFKGLKFPKFSGGACRRNPLAYDWLHVRVQLPASEHAPRPPVSGSDLHLLYHSIVVYANLTLLVLSRPPTR